MNPLAYGISSAFIDGAKDFIALLMKLSDKEMEEKKLGLKERELGLEEQRTEGLTNLYQAQAEHYKTQDALSQQKFELEQELLPYNKAIKALELENKKLENQLNIAKIKGLPEKQKLELQLLRNKTKKIEIETKLAEAKLKKEQQAQPIDNLKVAKTWIGLAGSVVNILQDYIGTETVDKIQQWLNKGKTKDAQIILAQKIEQILNSDQYSEQIKNTVRNLYYNKFIPYLNNADKALMGQGSWYDQIISPTQNSSNLTTNPFKNTLQGE